jgi:hypothetical protein
VHEVLLTNKAGAEFVIHNAGSTLRMSRNRKPAADMLGSSKMTCEPWQSINITNASIQIR